MYPANVGFVGRRNNDTQALGGSCDVVLIVSCFENVSGSLQRRLFGHEVTEVWSKNLAAQSPTYGCMSELLQRGFDVEVAHGWIM